MAAVCSDLPGEGIPAMLSSSEGGSGGLGFHRLCKKASPCPADALLRPAPVPHCPEEGEPTPDAPPPSWSLKLQHSLAPELPQTQCWCSLSPVAPLSSEHSHFPQDRRGGELQIPSCVLFPLTSGQMKMIRIWLSSFPQN